MKKRRILALAAALGLTLTACAGQAGQNAAPEKTEQTAQGEAGQNGEANDGASAAQSGEAKQSGATIEETVLFDQDGAKVTATELRETEYLWELDLLLENNGEKNLTIGSDLRGNNCNAINGTMISDGYLYSDVAAGKKAKETITFRKDLLALYGVGAPARMELSLEVMDSDYNRVYSGVRLLETSLAASYTPEEDAYQKAIVSAENQAAQGYSLKAFEAKEIYQKDGVRVVSSGIMTGEEGSVQVLLEAVNDTEQPLLFVTDNLCVNGMKVGSVGWSENCTINPGDRSIVAVNFSQDLAQGYWQFFGIRDFDTLALDVTLRDLDWNPVNEAETLTFRVPGAQGGLDKSGTELYQANGIRIVYKGIAPSKYDYSKDLNVLLLAENSGTQTLAVYDAYDTLSVNGFMTDYYFRDVELRPGECAMIEIRLGESALEKNGVGGISDVKDVEVGIEVRNAEFEVIDTAILKMSNSN